MSSSRPRSRSCRATCRGGAGPTRARPSTPGARPGTAWRATAADAWSKVGALHAKTKGEAMKIVAIGLTLAFAGFFATDAGAQGWQPPAADQRCPSKWGKDDERGAGNHMKPATVLRAAQLIKTGETFELAHELSPAMPLNPGRAWNLQVKRTTGPFGENQR